MKNKITVLAFCTMLSALGSSAAAQQPTKIPRIGYLSSTGDSTNPGPNIEAFRQGLRDFGYVEGKNILIEYRYLEGNVDRLRDYVSELLRLKVDVFVSPIDTAVRAAKQATATIPIVMVITGDPVAAGIVNSLARPGGNITGLTRFTRELSGKRLELLKDAVPRISRVGVLWSATNVSGLKLPPAFRDYEAAARALKIQLHSLEARNPNNPDFEGAFRNARNEHVSALIVVRATVLSQYPKRIADLAIKNRLPSMFESSDYADAGGLMSYSSRDTESFKRAAVYVDKILKGAKPADLPVEQPTKFEFVINLKTAKALNLTISPNVLARADKVIR